jgi:pyridoxine/pyridoxamine 5'-phosphate oxidase
MKMSDAVAEMIRNAKVAYVASADGQGRPHLAVSKLIRVLDAEHVTFTGWFCPQTTENIAKNPNVAVSIWDESRDHGFQLVGEVTKSTVTAVLDGWTGPNREFGPIPQEERRLTVAVQAVLVLTSATHSDTSI